MPHNAAIVTLLTDFGSRDYYVAAVKGTLLRLAPAVGIVDVTHEVAPGDVAEGAFLLAAAWPHFPAGTVHYAVVDPGVGSGRAVLAAARDGHFFVAPDNGLLGAVLDGATVHRVDRPDLYLAGPSSTFHGRDRFAPVAAHLARGRPLAELGPPATSPLRAAMPPPERGARELRGRIVHVDRFGNLVSDVPSGWLPHGGAGPVVATVGGRPVTAAARHYDGLQTGLPGIVPGSLGTVEFSLRGASLAERWGAGRGEVVSITLPPADSGYNEPAGRRSR